MKLKEYIYKVAESRIGRTLRQGRPKIRVMRWINNTLRLEATRAFRLDYKRRLYTRDLLVRSSGYWIPKSELHQFVNWCGSVVWMTDCEFLSQSIFTCHWSGLDNDVRNRRRLHLDDGTIVEISLYSVHMAQEKLGGPIYERRGEYYQTPPPPPPPRYGEFQGYHDNPRPWERTPNTDRTYGVELEIECFSRSNRTEVCQIAGNYQLLSESDASLDNDRGVEIIGPPMSFDHSVANDSRWMKFLADIKKLAEGYMAGGGRNYGIHISVNRASMSRDHQARLVVFGNMNRPLLEKVARRSSCEWCRYRNHINEANALTIDNRYDAISIRGEHRIEFRIFRSNIKPTGFKRNLELVDALVEYTSSRLENYSPDPFIEWVAERKDKYPNLCKDICPAKKTAINKQTDHVANKIKSLNPIHITA